GQLPGHRSGLTRPCSPRSSAPKSSCWPPCWPPSPTSTRPSATRLGKDRRGGLLARLPRVGQLSHAQLLAELGPILDRASSAEHAAAQAGAAPVTPASGETSSVPFR